MERCDLYNIQDYEHNNITILNSINTPYTPSLLYNYIPLRLSTISIWSTSQWNDSEMPWLCSADTLRRWNGRESRSCGWRLSTCVITSSVWHVGRSRYNKRWRKRKEGKLWRVWWESKRKTLLTQQRSGTPSSSGASKSFWSLGRYHTINSNVK